MRWSWRSFTRIIAHLLSASFLDDMMRLQWYSRVGFGFLFFISMVVINPLIVGAEPLKVIFVGKYRSGSSSLAVALRRLGYNPCHGRDVVYNAVRSHSQLADALMTGNISQILLATSDLGCNATLEMHAIFWKPIVEISSDDVKYIVVIRPFDAWRRSVTNLFKKLLHIHRYPLRLLPTFNKASVLFASLAQHESGFESREKSMEVIRHPMSDDFQNVLKKLYDDFVVDAHELLRNKPTQTLLFNLNEGYPPLCEFLNVTDCPDEPFPHISKSRDIQAEVFVGRVKEVLLHAAILTFAFLPILFFWRRTKHGKIHQSKR